MPTTMLKKGFHRYAGFAALCLAAWTTAAVAGGYDGATALTGVTGKVVEVNRYRVVEDVDPERIGLPKTFVVDFAAGVIRPSNESLVRKVARIGSISHVEGNLVLQGFDAGVDGVEDGLAWSMTISKKNGRAVLSASGNGIAYVIFGACEPVGENQSLDRYKKP